MSTLMRRWLGPIVVTSATATMALATWGTWPDPITDFGKEAYIAWQMSLGRRLYLDVAYHLGPVSPYINAIAFKIFGPTLATLEVLNFCVMAAILILAYRLLNRIAGPFAAAVAGVTFATLFAFTHFTPIADYNYISPYDHAHTHGLLLGLIGLTAAENHRRTGKTWTLIIAGFAVGLAFLTRAELFLAAAAGVGMILALKPREQAPWALRKYLTLAGSFLLPIVIAFLILKTTLPFAIACRGLLGSWPIVLAPSVAGNRFYRGSMGTLDVPASLWRLCRWTAWWTFLIAPAVAVGRLSRGKAYWIVAALLWGAAGAYVIGQFQDPAEAFSPLPLAMVGCLYLTLRRGGPNMAVSAGMIVWAITLLGKIVLNARIYHYGFALAMPATLLVVAIGSGWLSLPVRAAVVGALAVTIAAYLMLAFNLISRQSYSVGEGPDKFWADDRGRMLNDCLTVLRQHRLPGQTVAVMPEGAMLNFLVRMPNSTPYWSFNPPYAFFANGRGEVAGEQKMLNALQDHPPDWIAFAAEDLTDFGTPFFGKDYGSALYAFTQRGYTVQWSEGDAPFTGNGFGMMLLRRDRYNVPDHAGPSVGDDNAVPPGR